MASWIGASPAQRFWQYTVPAARQALNDGGWLVREQAKLATQAEQLKIELEAAEPGSLAARRAARRLEECRRDWRSLRDKRAFNLATLAEADRRQARKA